MANRRSTVRWTSHASLLLTVTLAVPLSLAAQDPDDLSVVLRGKVLDGLTDAPVHGAFVAPTGSDQGYLTQEDGSFTLTVPRSDFGYAVTVENLGYETADFTLASEDAAHGIVLRVRPNPVVLEGLRVMSDRFGRRRKGTPVSSRAFGREDLLTAGAMDAVSYLRFRTGLTITACRDGTMCILYRGRRVIPQVFIDEAQVFGGLEQLETYQPQDFYLIEVYSRGRMVRVYTQPFMDRLAKRGRLLQPLPLFYFN